MFGTNKNILGNLELLNMTEDQRLLMSINWMKKNNKGFLSHTVEFCYCSR